MPPPKSFSKDEILNAAFGICEETGIEKLTIRKIAGRLGCSIQPLYSNFRNIEEIKEILMDRIFGILVQYTDKKFSDNNFLNIGLGILAFARDHKLLYKTLFINSNRYSGYIDAFFARNLKLMEKDEYLKGLSVEERSRILEKTRLFTHGLATFVCSGNLEDKSDEYLAQLLKDTGEDVVGYAILKSKGLSLKKGSAASHERRESD